MWSPVSLLIVDWLSSTCASSTPLFFATSHKPKLQQISDIASLCSRTEMCLSSLLVSNHKSGSNWTICGSPYSPLPDWRWQPLPWLPLKQKASTSHPQQLLWCLLTFLSFCSEVRSVEMFILVFNVTMYFQTFPKYFICNGYEGSTKFEFIIFFRLNVKICFKYTTHIIDPIIFFCWVYFIIVLFCISIRRSTFYTKNSKTSSVVCVLFFCILFYIKTWLIFFFF